MNALPTLEELETILAANHRATGRLPYVNDLRLIREASFLRGEESVKADIPGWLRARGWLGAAAEFERLNPVAPVNSRPPCPDTREGPR